MTAYFGSRLQPHFFHLSDSENKTTAHWDRLQVHLIFFAGPR
jgi:hypothetical protein